MAEATISLITTACDRRAHLRELLLSLWRATSCVLVSDTRPWGMVVDDLVWVPRPFNLARWRNLGAARAKTDILFFCDADMLLPPTFRRECLKNVKPGQVWFPMCIDMMEDGGAEPDWREPAWGNCGIMRADFEKTGGWNEKRTTWGKEDSDFHEKVRDMGLTIVRNHFQGFFHQWHPTTPGFLNKHRG